MIRTLILFTLREKTATRLTRYYGLGLALLFLCNLLVQAKSLNDQIKDRNRVRDRLEDIATLETNYVLQPPNAASFISSSNESILPVWLAVKPYEVVDVGGTTEPASLLLELVRIDWRVIIGMWCSIAAMLFACDSVSNRKASSLLRFSWSFPISRAHYFIGRAIGQLLTVYLPLVVCAAIVLIAELIFLHVIGYTEQVSSITIGAVFVLIAAIPFLLFFILLGWLVSILWSSESSAILGGLSIWILFVWMWPALGMTLGLLTTPLQRYQNASAQWSKVETDALGSLSSATLREIVLKPIDEEEKIRRIRLVEEDLEEQAEHNIEKAEVEARSLRVDYALRRKQQTLKAMQFVGFSPYGLWESLLNEIALSGYRRYNYFLEQATNYSVLFGQYSDQLQAQMKDTAQYQSVGVTGYGGYMLHQRAGRSFDHIKLPQSAPTFSWQTPGTTLLFMPFFNILIKLVALTLPLLIMVMIGLRTITLI